MVAATWIRPEWLAPEVLYGAWLIWRYPKFRTWPMLAMFGIGLASFPIAWFVPPWIGSGDAFLAASHAAQYNGNLGPHPFIAVNSRGINDQVLPILAFAIAGFVIGWLKDRRGLVFGLGLGVVLYYVVVVVETLKGYPGLERFFLPAASLICVLGGYGMVRLAQLARELVATRATTGNAGRGRRRGHVRRPRGGVGAVHHDADQRGARRLPAGVAGGHDLESDDEGRRRRRRPHRRVPVQDELRRRSTTAFSPRWRGS